MSDSFNGEGTWFEKHIFYAYKELEQEKVIKTNHIKKNIENTKTYSTQ